MEDSEITFKRHAAVYIAKLEKRRRKKVKRATVETVRSVVEFAMPVLGEIPLHAIESENLRLLVDYLAEHGYAPNTIRQTVRTVKTIISSLVDEKGNRLIVKTWNNDHIDQPDAANLRHGRSLAAEDIERALAQAPPVIQEFMATQAATGARRGELLALNVEDFDPIVLIIRVARTYGYYGETEPKTPCAKRDIDLHPDIAAMLKRMLAGRTTGRLFDVTPDAVRRAFEKFSFRSHALRHFRYGVLGVSVPSAIRDAWIGHSGVKLEKVYGHTAAPGIRKKFALECGIGFRLPVFAIPEQQEALAVSA